MSRAAPKMSRTDGWHATGTVGAMAVAAACARLLKAPAAAIPDIIGITASLASGVSANFGSMTKPLHSGHAARDGILAVLLGAKGFTASASALEGRDGFFENFARGLDWSLEPFKDLGQSYDLAQIRLQAQALPERRARSHGHRRSARTRSSVPLSDIASVEVAITKYAGAPLYRPLSPVDRECQVQRALSRRLYVGPRRADACRIHRGSAVRRGSTHFRAQGLACDLSRIRRRA